MVPLLLFLQSIDPGQQFTWEHSNLEVNKPKNRYANVIAYDHSRVILAPIDGENQHNYTTHEALLFIFTNMKFTEIIWGTQLNSELIIKSNELLFMPTELLIMSNEMPNLSDLLVMSEELLVKSNETGGQA